MRRIFYFLFTRHFFPERILFLSITGGMLIDGWLTSVFKNWPTEALLRIVISLIAAVFFLFTYSKKLTRKNIRPIAYCSIVLLLSFSAYLNVLHHFDNDNALTFLGAYIICSLYFLSVRDLIFYLLFGFLLACGAVLVTVHPHITSELFVLRLFLGALLVLSLSFATRQFQEQLQQFSKKIAEENRSLNETRIALEERLTREHLLALVASRANTVVIISGADDKIEWVNEGFTEITGYTSKDAIGKQVAFLRGPGTDHETAERIQDKKNKLIPFHETILNYKKDGTPVWMRMHVTPLIDENGKLERFISIQEDISEIKNTEVELRRSRELLKTAQRQAKIGSWEWNDANKALTCSDEMSRILGREGDKFPSPESIMKLVHPGDLNVLQKTIENGLRRSSPFEIDFRIVINGIIKYVYLTGQAVSARNNRTEILSGTLQDITERKQIENEMRVAEKQYRSLFEHSQHMIFIHDLEGNILSINPAGAKALSVKTEEIIGRKIKPVLWPGKIEEYEKYMHMINHEGHAQGLLRLKMNDGSTTVWLYNNILLNDLGGIPYVLSSNVEITGRVEMEKELRMAKKLADESLVMKDRFVANISHELRTPMNAIIGFSDLLLKTNLTVEQREYLQAIHIAGDNLTSMINDVLDLAKIEAGKIEFEAKPFEVRNIMSNTHRLLSQTASQSGLNFEWNCDPDVPSYVLGDELRLTQILINLVGNAIKYTERGFVNFNCSIKSEDDETIELEFVIEDSGIGIAPEKLKVIFDPFIQVSAESTRRFGGTGLGLSIVRDLVELQGGSVSVKSAEGIGSAFTVVLPVKKVSMEVIQQVEKALQPMESPGNIRVLLVEDQPLNQQLAKKLISDFGFTTEVAFNGKSAVEFLRNESFDIVLMDLQMPEMDGYEATKIIRKKLLLDLPIIALTAHSSAGEREKCLALGMNDYLIKPFRAQELYFKIVSSIRKKVEGNIPLEHPKNEENPIRALSGGDKNFEHELIEIMLKSIPEDISKMIEAIQEKDFVSARSIAHRLKSSVALAGEHELAAILEDCEKSCIASQVPENISDKLKEISVREKKLMEKLKKDLEEIGL
jgi:PAS domain S-box-containing protein